jgi:hypothetical protein
MLKNTIIVTFSAPEHSGKTSLEAAFAKLLLDHGITVRLPPDQQRDDKMAMSMEDLLAAFKGKGIDVMVMETNAT